MAIRFAGMWGNTKAWAAVALLSAGCGGGAVVDDEVKDMAIAVRDMAMPAVDLSGDMAGQPVVDMATRPCPMSPDNLFTDNITRDTTLIAGCTYFLEKSKYIFVTSGVTLNIEPGVTIKGRQGSVLVISRGARINAVGTRDKVIVLTTDQADDKKTPGFWGGLLVLGKAPVNNNRLSMPPSNEIVYEAFTMAMDLGKFGGDDAADNSGTIKYLRVEFGGFNFINDREFNNITLAGVGSGTTVDYVQAHGGSDDGVEIFGGTVNVKHVISSQNGDDGFDTDNGWQGKGQFIVVQNVNPQGAVEASNGYESDNHGTAASFRADPRTMPTIYNATILGKVDYAGGTSWAGVIRRGTGGKYFNHIIMNFPKALEFRDAATREQLDAGNLFFKNSIVFMTGAGGSNYPSPQMTGMPPMVDPNDIDEKSYFEKVDWSNRMGVDPGLDAAAFSTAAPNFKPKAGAAALMGGATPPSDGFFDATATFVGAVGSDDWTAGWAKYTPFAL